MHGLTKGGRRIARKIVASPGDEPVGPYQQAAAVGYFADLDPFAIDIVEVLAQADASGPDRHAELGRDRRGGLDPARAGDTHDEREPRIVAHIERRDPRALVLQP